MELTPKTRKEVFLAAAGGQDVTTPTPVTREEVFLDAIAKGGGGGSSGGGVLVVHEDENNTLDKTYAEIKSASNDSVVLVHSGDDILYLTAAGYNPILGAYTVAFFGKNVFNRYNADAEDGYPVHTE